MTDISAATPITFRRFKLPQLVLPRLAIGASFNAINLLIGNALNMAYVDPYAGLCRREQAIPEDDLDGRDPSW